MSTRAKLPAGREPVRPEAVTPTLLRAWPLPGGGSGKDDRGSVLVIGGARMTPGAALLAGRGRAALRRRPAHPGRGGVRGGAAGGRAARGGRAWPAGNPVGLGQGGSAAAVLVAAELESADAVLVGPGLDDKDEATALLRGLLKAARGEAAAGHHPRCLCPGQPARSSAGELGPWAGRLILTPNVTEAGILLGHDAERPGTATSRSSRRSTGPW